MPVRFHYCDFSRALDHEMANIEVHDMGGGDEYFVATCSHVHESDETDACARRRLAWLRNMHTRGVRVKVGTVDGKHAGFAYVMPIEASPWGPVGHDLATLNCLWVLEWAKHVGVGRALVTAAETEARRQACKALTTTAYYHDFWFMPAPFFESCDFEIVSRRETAAILWKVFDPAAEPPTFLQRRYRYKPAPGKVVIDLFWNAFCATSTREAQHVREVAAEFGEAVVLHENRADDLDSLLRHQTPRAIFVNGREIAWGYAAPRDGIRAALQRALDGAGGASPPRPTDDR
jgi:GNAT superfamily N-acetyltransferase